MLPSGLAQRLGQNQLGPVEDALLPGQQAEEGDKGDSQSQSPPGLYARAEGGEEELYRPPFRHQVPLPIRRGEAKSRRW